MKPEIFKPTNKKIGLNGKGMKYKQILPSLSRFLPVDRFSLQVQGSYQ